MPPVIAGLAGSAVGSAVGGGVMGAVAGGLTSYAVGNAMGGSGGGSSAQQYATQAGGIAGAVLSAEQASTLRAAGETAAGKADPFATDRKAYQAQLMSLMQNPASIADTPMYKFLMEQSMTNVNRAMGAKGLLTSGARGAELTKQAQGLASSQFFNYANLLSGMAMQGTNPTAAGQLYLNATESSMGLQGQATQQALAAMQPTLAGGGQTSTQSPSSDLMNAANLSYSPNYGNYDFNAAPDYSLASGTGGFGMTAPTTSTSNYDFTGTPNYSLF